MYEIIFDEKVLEMLRTLQKKDRKRIYEKIIST
jgi:mRNA-degrading endonuclease RelE of RelBE toxin-antitoxin system